MNQKSNPMLSKEQYAEIQGWGIDNAVLDKLVNAIKAIGVVELELPKGKFYGDDVIITRDESLRQQGIAEGHKAGFKEGKDKGIEIQGSVLLKKFGIEATNIKVGDPDKVAESIHAITAKGDTGLQEQVKQLLADKQQIEAKFQQKEQELLSKTFDTNLIANMPQKRNAKLFNDSEFLMAMKANLDFETSEDGKIFVKEKAGDYLRHPDTKAQLTLKEGLESYYAKRGWVESEQQSQPAGGRGGKDGLPGGATTGIKSFSQYKAKWEAANPGKDIAHPDSVSAMQIAAKESGDAVAFYNS